MYAETDKNQDESCESFADRVVNSLRSKGYVINNYDKDCIDICSSVSGQSIVGYLWLNHDYIRKPQGEKPFINETERWCLLNNRRDEDLSYKVRSVADEISGSIEVNVLSPDEDAIDGVESAGIDYFNEW